MKITFVGLNYAPDLVGIAPYNVRLCDFFVEKGHKLLIITSFPHYPQWHKRKCDHGKLVRKEIMDDRVVYRTYLYVPSKAGALRRILYDISFTLSSIIPSLFVQKPDIFYIVSPPLTLGLVGFLVSKLRNVPFVIQINDLIPDTPVALGIIRNKAIVSILYAIENFIYRKAKLIFAVSESMRANIIQKGISPEKIEVRYDFVDTNIIRPLSKNNSFREEFSLDNKFIVLHAGNMGLKMGLDLVLDTAKKFQDDDKYSRIQFLFVGDGVCRAQLEIRARDLGLENVLFLPLQPFEKLSAMVSTADIALVIQKRDVKDICFPGKLLTYMACATPVVAAVEEASETAIQIKMSDCGVIVQPEDAESLFHVIAKLYENSKIRINLGKNGRTAIMNRFEKYKVLGKFHSRLLTLVEVNQH